MGTIRKPCTLRTLYWCRAGTSSALREPEIPFKRTVALNHEPLLFNWNNLYELELRLKADKLCIHLFKVLLKDVNLSSLFNPFLHQGTVIIIANHGDRIDIPAGAMLENKIVSGNLRILDHWGLLGKKMHTNIQSHLQLTETLRDSVLQLTDEQQGC